jgi:hypothetical protein
VHLRRDGGGHFAARALEVVPITAMNRAPQPLPPAEAARRVAVLNVLAESLDDAAAGSAGVRFAVRADGSGLYCADGAAADPGPIGALCSGYTGPTPPSAEARERVRAAPDPSHPQKRPRLAQREKHGKKRRLGQK